MVVSPAHHNIGLAATTSAEASRNDMTLRSFLKQGGLMRDNEILSAPEGMTPEQEARIRQQTIELRTALGSETDVGVILAKNDLPLINEALAQLEGRDATPAMDAPPSPTLTATDTPDVAGTAAEPEPIDVPDLTSATAAIGQGSLLSSRHGVGGSDTNKSIQEALEFIGHDVGDKGIDGFIGPDTTAAIRQFQAEQGLKTDGIIGGNTIAALQAAVEEQKAALEAERAQAPTQTMEAPEVAAAAPTTKPAPEPTTVAPPADVAAVAPPTYATTTQTTKASYSPTGVATAVAAPTTEPARDPKQVLHDIINGHDGEPYTTTINGQQIAVTPEPITAPEIRNPDTIALLKAAAAEAGMENSVNALKSRALGADRYLADVKAAVAVDTGQAPASTINGFTPDIAGNAFAGGNTLVGLGADGKPLVTRPATETPPANTVVEAGESIDMGAAGYEKLASNLEAGGYRLKAPDARYYEAANGTYYVDVETYEVVDRETGKAIPATQATERVEAAKSEIWRQRDKPTMETYVDAGESMHMGYEAYKDLKARLQEDRLHMRTPDIHMYKDGNGNIYVNVGPYEISNVDTGEELPAAKAENLVEGIKADMWREVQGTTVTPHQLEGPHGPGMDDIVAAHPVGVGSPTHVVAAPTAEIAGPGQAVDNVTFASLVPPKMATDMAATVGGAQEAVDSGPAGTEVIAGTAQSPEHAAARLAEAEAGLLSH